MNISVLGDSMSTYKGWSNNVINPGEGGEYYPNPSLTSVNQMWWMQVYNQIGGTKLVSVDAIGGSCVAFYDETENDDEKHIGKKWCMNNQLRINDLGDPNVSSGNCPDVILFFGGTNDLSRSNYNTNTFTEHYSHVLRMIYDRYSNNPVVMCITPYTSIFTNNPFNEEDDRIKRQNFENLCYGIYSSVNYYRSFGYRCIYVSLMDIDLSKPDIDDSAHPTASGMQILADRISYMWSHS